MRYSEAALVSRSLIIDASRLNGVGPLGLARVLQEVGKQLGACSIAYNLKFTQNDKQIANAFRFYASRKSTARSSFRTGFGDEDYSWLSRILAGGTPVSLATVASEEALTKYNDLEKFLNVFADSGFTDVLCVPVYGPHRIDAVISFGFDRLLDEDAAADCEGAAAILAMLHVEFVKIFYSPERDSYQLSTRELEVLKWISQGKSSNEMARILRISPASIDTYTRRLFKKLGVNDRVSAAVVGANAGLVTS